MANRKTRRLTVASMTMGVLVVAEGKFWIEIRIHVVCCTSSWKTRNKNENYQNFPCHTHQENQSHSFRLKDWRSQLSILLAWQHANLCQDLRTVTFFLTTIVGGLTVVAYISISCVFSYMVLLRTIQSIWIYDYDYDQMFCSHRLEDTPIFFCIEC